MPTNRGVVKRGACGNLDRKFQGSVEEMGVLHQHPQLSLQQDTGELLVNPSSINRLNLLAQSIDPSLRLKEVLTYVPVKKSTWWGGIKTGRFPAPEYPLGPKIPLWKLSTIIKLMNGGN